MDNDDDEVNGYLFRYPTFQDVKFLDDNDPIGTEISDDENSQTKRLTKCNGWTELYPRARTVYSLMIQNSVNIWNTKNIVIPKDYKDFLLQSFSPQNLSKIKKSANYQEEVSSEMATRHKSEKRKREDNSKEEIEHHKKKIPKLSDKKPNHTLSSDDSSDYEENLVVSGATYINGQESNRISDATSSRVHQDIPNNTVSVSEEDVDNPADYSSSESSNCEIDRSAQQADSQSIQNKESIGNLQQTSTALSQKQRDSTCSENEFKEHIFTRKDEEELSKFSSLLSGDIVENNHMWILQCPTSMDCSRLVGQKLNLSGSCKLDIGNKTYESFSYKSKVNRFSTLAVPSHRNQLQLVKIPIAGNVIVEDYLDITSDSSFSVKEMPRYMELPDNLPTRHPLFGKNYKKQLKMAKRMDGVTIKEEPVEMSSEQESFEGNSLEVNSFKRPKKKKKKRSMHNSFETNMSESDTSFTVHSPKKKKKRKKEH